MSRKVFMLATKFYHKDDIELCVNNHKLHRPERMLTGSYGGVPWRAGRHGGVDAKSVVIGDFPAMAGQS